MLAGDLKMSMPVRKNPSILDVGCELVKEYIIKNATALVRASRYSCNSVYTVEGLTRGASLVALKWRKPVNELSELFGDFS